MSVEFYAVAVFVVTIISAARITRVLTYDDFPPVKWLRDKFDDFMDKTPRRRAWGEITVCPYCLAPWVTAVLLGWAWVAGVYSDQGVASNIWWFVNGSFAIAYLAAIFMVNDSENTKDHDDEEID